MSNSDVIRYDLIVQEAMLGVVKQVLTQTEKDGLPADHHFYLTYATNFAGVDMPSHLLEKYPDEITIVLQHEFEDLRVLENSFEVTLWFNNIPAHLKIPYKAIRAFFDPSVKFGLQFNAIEESTAKNDVADISTLAMRENLVADKISIDNINTSDAKSNIISLDSFRKK